MKTHTDGKDRAENYTAECKDIYYRTDHGFAICYNINPVVVGGAGDYFQKWVQIFSECYLQSLSQHKIK